MLLKSAERGKAHSLRRCTELPQFEKDPKTGYHRKNYANHGFDNVGIADNAEPSHKNYHSNDQTKKTRHVISLCH